MSQELTFDMPGREKPSYQIQLGSLVGFFLSFQRFGMNVEVTEFCIMFIQGAMSIALVIFSSGYVYSGL